MVTVLVLGLIFVAVSYYLYSRTSQLERKVGLMENILLDLKVTTEQALMSATDPQMYKNTSMTENKEDTDNEEEDDNNNHEESRNVEVNTTPKPRSSQQPVTVEREKSTTNTNYEAMTYKELVQLAKNKGISGTRNLSKAQVIDMIRRHVSGDVSLTTFDEDASEGTNLTELLSAQPANGTKLDELDIDTSLVQ